MKRLLLTIIIALIGFATSAQTDGTAKQADSNTVADSTVAYEPLIYQSPRGGAMRYFGHDFCTYFAETKMMLGNDLAIGLSFTYLPDKWGAFGSYMYGTIYDWFSLGAAYRLSEPWQRTDWQLMAGLNYGERVGYEIGLRLASNSTFNGGSTFCWMSSVSLEIARNAGHTYVMLGLSFDIMSLPCLLIPFLL